MGSRKIVVPVTDELNHTARTSDGGVLRNVFVPSQVKCQPVLNLKSILPVRVAPVDSTEHVPRRRVGTEKKNRGLQRVSRNRTLTPRLWTRNEFMSMSVSVSV